MRFLDLIVRQARVPREQKGFDLTSPEQVDNFLVRENGVRE
jgi:hypothetical protein